MSLHYCAQCNEPAMVPHIRLLDILYNIIICMHRPGGHEVLKD